MARILILCVCNLALLVTTAGADKIVLSNGNELSGTITKLVDGQLEFKTDLAGDVTVALEDIDTLSTDGPVVLELADGRKVDRRISSSESGTFGIEGSADDEDQELEITDIAAINRPAKPKPRWEGGLSLGWTVTTGNSRSDNRSASFNARKRMEKHRITLGADYGRGEQRDPVTRVDIRTEDWWRLVGKYDYFFMPVLYGFVNGLYETDAIAQLDRRTILGGGAGYQWIDTERTNIGLELGLASRYEKYDTSPSGSSNLSAQLGYHILHNISDTTTVTHNLTYLPSTERVSDYFLTTNAEITTNFNKHFFGTFRILFNYDSTPAIGQGSTDLKYILGLGLNF
ncbi:YdiY family protein [Planctomycetota bacterium]